MPVSYISPFFYYNIHTFACSIYALCQTPYCTLSVPSHLHILYYLYSSLLLKTPLLSSSKFNAFYVHFAGMQAGMSSKKKRGRDWDWRWEDKTGGRPHPEPAHFTGTVMTRLALETNDMSAWAWA